MLRKMNRFGAAGPGVQDIPYDVNLPAAPHTDVSVDYLRPAVAQADGSVQMGFVLRNTGQLPSTVSNPPDMPPGWMIVNNMNGVTLPQTIPANGSMDCTLIIPASKVPTATHLVGSLKVPFSGYRSYGEVGPGMADIPYDVARNANPPSSVGAIIAGAVAGFFVGGPAGAALGAAIVGVMSKKQAPPATDPGKMYPTDIVVDHMRPRDDNTEVG